MERRDRSISRRVNIAGQFFHVAKIDSLGRDADGRERGREKERAEKKDVKARGSERHVASVGRKRYTRRDVYGVNHPGRRSYLRFDEYRE